MTKAWYEIRNATATSADLYLYEEIGAWGTTAAEFVQELTALEVTTLNVHINSPGGSVFDGFAIYNALSAHPARVLVSVDGIAASIASVGSTTVVGHGVAHWTAALQCDAPYGR